QIKRLPIEFCPRQDFFVRILGSPTKNPKLLTCRDLFLIFQQRATTLFRTSYQLVSGAVSELLAVPSFPVSLVRFFERRPCMRRIAVFAGVLLLSICTPVLAQTLGTISGEIKDTSGAVMPGVTVTVVNKATNATRTAVTNSVGLFEFPALQPGT